MEKLRAFQVAAQEGGFVGLNKSVDGSVLWLRKNEPDSGKEMHQRLCIDSLTNSATVYWMTALGKFDSKTFRGVSNLRAWFALDP
jgi:hypothetical protein